MLWRESVAETGGKANLWPLQNNSQAPQRCLCPLDSLHSKSLIKLSKSLKLKFNDSDKVFIWAESGLSQLADQEVTLTYEIAVFLSFSGQLTEHHHSAASSRAGS